MGDTIGAVFAALADPTRRAILDQVRTRPRSVSDVAGVFSISRPAVSQHLRVLQEAGLLRSRRHGRQNFYGIDMQALVLVRSYVEAFWDDALGAFHAAAVDESKRRKT
jgi:DNA-binding transcriptional ArsR family regulator